MDQDKRKRTRVPVHFEVAVLIREEVVQVRIINISLTGLLCTSSPLFQEDLPCKVIVSLSDDLKITIDSKVVRVDSQETAIGFLAMDEGSFVHLKKVLEYNAGDADLIEQELHKQAFD